VSYRTQIRSLLGVVALTACGAGPNSEGPCPEAAGEFPPSHCAYVTGRLTAGGVPVAGAGFRVADFVPPVGFAYLSDDATSDAQGRFSFLVFRLNEFRTPAVPDTATLYVKVYPSPPDFPGPPTDDSVAVLMTFAPMGTPVDTTEVELTLP
jgi:hypothetical protein